MQEQRGAVLHYRQTDGTPLPRHLPFPPSWQILPGLRGGSR